MVDLTNESDKREVGVPALEQVYGKSVARAAKRQRNARLGMTSEGRKPGWGSYAILIVTLLIFVFPLYYALSIASQNTPSNQYGVRALIPGTALLHNLSRALGELKFWQAFGGTVTVAVVVSVSTVFFSTLAGYSFAKLHFRGRSVLLTAVVATMTIPQQLTVYHGQQGRIVRQSARCDHPGSGQCIRRVLDDPVHHRRLALRID